MDFQLIQDILNSGSDAAMIMFAWAIWKVERRVFRLEFRLDNIFTAINKEKKNDA